ncbi:NADH dehydrogenase [ubiquinone] 1 beta subcomplex subunit 2, mitochondrial isoform X2 [Sapajus apella]|uniref:NADH dehydrogenase [ubiquinone] 1 beta subcomplex subunit 2, mitochondrial isoform X2 n=1 Tax=Sapajus apella TaxID=9515 RepID=A0A6J3HNL6_SAPAP|nr:NADH dehydrogenase [ubiquinone] 1 beta subcomplex subunit 2, mitochondrial isoform X2 [Sapajus apella]
MRGLCSRERGFLQRKDPQLIQVGRGCRLPQSGRWATPRRHGRRGARRRGSDVCRGGVAGDDWADAGEHVGSNSAGVFSRRWWPPFQKWPRTGCWRRWRPSGHFPYPDPSQWTDEELGIPPDDED